MSKLTLDEAISHALEVAEQNETQADKWQEEGGEQWGKTTVCRECAAEHRQLAEWLTDYKELKNSIGAIKLSNMKEALELIREYKAENIAQKKMIAEYKRLLKMAVEDLEKIAAVDECSFPYCDSRCPFECIGQCEEKHWKHLDEALKLIGDESNK